MLRFIEIDTSNNFDPEKRFLSWENTVLVKASNFDEAYDKVEEIAESETMPYKGGPDGDSVQWIFNCRNEEI